jgi:predicted dehydrogenase
LIAGVPKTEHCSNLTTRLAVVGAGFMGRLHAKVIAGSEVASLAAVVDTNPAARTVADALGAAFHSSIEPLLGSDDVDGFVVCLPDREHVETTCALLDAGHAVLLEKPIADSLAGARRIAAAARLGRLLVGHILRFDPRYVQAAATVRSGALGDVLHMSSGRLGGQDIGLRLGSSSSVLFYLGVHDVDLLQWISGRRIVRVSSIAGPRMDVIVTNAELEDGIVAQLHAGWTLRPDTPSPVNAHTLVACADGALEIDTRDHGLRVHSSAGVQLPDALHWPEANGRITGDLADELRHFAVSIMRDEPFLMDVEEAVSTAAVNDAILRSLETGRPEQVAVAEAA